jgi:hypothetical protein
MVEVCSEDICRGTETLIETDSTFIALVIGDCVYELKRVLRAMGEYARTRGLAPVPQRGQQSCNAMLAFVLEDPFTALALSEAAQRLLRVLLSVEKGCAF